MNNLIQYKEFVNEMVIINKHEELSYIKMGKGRYCERMINKGYHSYSGECKIDNINIVHDPKVFKIYSKDKKNNKYVINAYVHEKIGVFIIPKGTEYYENEKGEIVSSTIIWTGNCNINEDLREEFQEIKLKIMCWKVNNRRTTKKFRKIAEMDIAVYKFGDINDDKFFPCFHHMFGYKSNIINDEVKLKIRRKRLFGFPYINDGYHAYSGDCIYAELKIFPKNSICEALCNINLVHLMTYYGSSYIGKFIIPQGTEYYENSDGEIVSSNIIWSGEGKHIAFLHFKEPKAIRLKDFFSFFLFA